MKDFFSKCDQIRRNLRIYIFCAVLVVGFWWTDDDDDDDDDNELLLRNDWPMKDVNPYFEAGLSSQFPTISKLPHSTSSIWICTEP